MYNIGRKGFRQKEGCLSGSAIELEDGRQLLFYTGMTKDVFHSRSFTVSDRAGELKLRIVMDRQSVEIFANDGEDAASFVFFSPLSAAVN